MQSARHAASASALLSVAKPRLDVWVQTHRIQLVEMAEPSAIVAAG
jgi:hypothetical protein